MLFVNSTELIILLVVCAVAAACFVAAVVLLVWTVRNQRRKQRGNRELVEIVADCKDVKSEFSFGQEFSCEGLLVNAVYNRNPKSEALSLFDVLTEEELVRLTEAGAASGLYVIKPNMEETGRTNVIVRYKDKATYYAITIAEPAQESTQEPVQEPHEEPAQEVIVQRREPIAPEEESYEGVLRYNKSFMAKYIQSSDDVKNRYTALKNEMLSYKKVKARTSWKRETFRLGREVVARLGYRGNTLCIYLPLNAADYTDSKYKVEDVSETTAYADTPCMYRLKNDRRTHYAFELFAAVMEKVGGKRIERVAEDFYLPYEGIVELIDKGLAKRTVKKKSAEPTFLQAAATVAKPTSGEGAPN